MKCKLKKMFLCILLICLLTPCVFIFNACSSKTNYVGDTAKTKNGVEFTVTNVVDAKSYTRSNGEVVTTENNYVCVSLDVVNRSNDSIFLQAGTITCFDTYLKQGDKKYSCMYIESSKSGLMPEESCTLLLVYVTVYSSTERDSIIFIEPNDYEFISMNSTIKILLKNK